MSIVIKNLVAEMRFITSVQRAIAKNLIERYPSDAYGKPRRVPIGIYVTEEGGLDAVCRVYHPDENGFYLEGFAERISVFDSEEAEMLVKNISAMYGDIQTKSES